jgi:putative hydrolase of the HAD superfamily
MESSFSSNCVLPKVIFLDAMGTIFGMRETVGKVYQKIAWDYGVATDSQKLDLAFSESFRAARPLAFKIKENDSIHQQEFTWWADVVKITFIKVGGFERFTNFPSFMEEVYHYFATEQPWYVYPDVVSSLKKWQQQNIQLGIISNFDTRLERVLKVLDLEQFFDSITISSLAGAAKPNSQIFQIALDKHHATADQAWHIGDSFVEDYQGAQRLGIKAFWLNRKELSALDANQLPNLESVG